MSYPHPQQDPWADPSGAHPAPPPSHLPPTRSFELPVEHHLPAPTSPAQPNPPVQHHPPTQPYPPAQQYAPAPSPYLPVQQQPYGMPHPGQPVYAVPVVPAKSAGAAVALELVPGLFGIFGIGSMYAGRVGAGIALMVSYWVLFWINVALFLVGIGFVTIFLTWMVFMIVGPLLALSAVGRHNSGRVVR
ncbi:hypothetical protein ACIBF5_04610 [Micromonospora sp. NPDC050417]|uniref:hypothetical protein n=1 Tax=Micromonospora sp. NPDC050417 TaxID=3364280 RepID=UPI00379D7215